MSSIIWVSIIQLIVTMILVGVTWWYAKHTKRMADVMARDYETRLSPIIEVTPGDTEKKAYEATTSRKIENIGNYVCYIRGINLILYMPDEQPVRETRKTILEEEFSLNPQGTPRTLPIRLDRDDFRGFNIELAPGRYHIGIHIKVDMEMEAAGPDRIFKKATYKVF